MKKGTFTICLLLLVKLLFAQDIIVKKDGTRIKSKILKVTITEISYKNFFDLEGPTYTLRSREISSYAYENETTSKDSKPTDNDYGINKEEKKLPDTSNSFPNVDVNEYGSHFSMGFAIGGGGIIGMPIRVFLHRNIPFEIAVHLRPILFAKATTNSNGTNSLSSIEIYPNLLITGEFDFFFGRKYVPYKRISLSGIFIKGGYSSGTRFNGILGAIGWQYERFKLYQKNNSFSFGLGIGVEQLTDKTAKQNYNRGGYGPLETTQKVYVKPMLYWKIAWNLFIRTKKQVKS